jgi:fluoroacetyl-CoA thioesterase
MTPEPGLAAEVRYTVTEADTAVAHRSGDVPVLATPRLLAWAEEATVRAVEGRLDADTTSVGTQTQLEHLRPTAVGGVVTVTARLVHVDGRLLRFEVTAIDDGGQTIGQGQITRVVVHRDRFLSRVSSNPARH